MCCCLPLINATLGQSPHPIWFLFHDWVQWSVLCKGCGDFRPQLNGMARRRGIWTSTNGRETAKWKFWWGEAETNWILWLVLSFPSLRPRLGQLLEAGSLAKKKERGMMILLTEKRQNVFFSWWGLSLVGNEGVQIHHCSTAPCKGTATNSKAQKVSENASEGPWGFFVLPVTSLLSCLHA